MKSTVFFVAAVCLPTLVAACGGQSPSDADTASSAAVQSDAQEGERCGGFVTNPRKCADGLVCDYQHVPDIPGTCVVNTAPAQQGEHCGGFVAHPRTCDVGLVCVSDSNTVDLPGTCQPDDGPPACQAASDCSGFLPHNCAACADGTTQCAHWDCNGGACQIATCDDKGGAAIACNDLSGCPDGEVCTGSNGGPGVCTPAPAGNDCTNAGGSCVALSPGSCASGQVGDASQYSCGGGLGVECCLPN
jgi:hypothetical protein